jgi:hypothetical protein
VSNSQINLDATEHDGGLDELVEWNIGANPPSTAEDIEAPSVLPIEAREHVVEVSIQFWVGRSAAEERQRQARGPSMYIRLRLDDNVYRFLLILCGLQLSSEVQIQDVLLADDTDRGVFNGSD